MHLFRLLFLFSLLLTGCQQRVLYVYQQKVDPKYLASTNVGSPDPRTPPKGQMVVAEWWLPKGAMKSEPVLRIQTLFCNYTEDCVEYPITSMVGSKTYWVLNDDFDETGGLLAYRAEIVTCEGECIANWEHQLWVNVIDIDDETDMMSSRVSR